MTANPNPWDPEATPAEQWQAERRKAIADETTAMRDVFTALQPLDHAARCRALRWASDALENVEVPF